MELRQLRSFIVLSEELHFGRAAARLFLAQPALSQQIKRLETHLGTALFQRTSRTVALTETGKAFLPHARAAVRMLAQGEEELKTVESGVSGTVRVAFVSTAAVQLVPNLLKNLKKIYPTIRLQLKEADTGRQVEGLLSGDFDIGLMHATDLHEGLVAHPVETGELVLVLPAKHPLASLPRVPLSALARETLLLPARSPHKDLHSLILEFCEANGFTPAERQEVTMLQTALPLVAAGVGCALIPGVFQHLRVRGICFRRISGSKLKVPVYCVIRRDSVSRLVANVLRQIRSSGVKLQYGRDHHNSNMKILKRSASMA